jgi:hypothetical protein
MQELDPSVYEAIVYPDAIILIWLECKRQANPWTGVPALPEPEKGYLDQDAELTLAFEVLDEIQAKHEEEEEKRKKLREQAAAMFNPAGKH